MTWNEYNTLLIPLIQKFGAFHYSKDMISKGFFHWKSKTKQELIDQINEAIASNIPLELVKITRSNAYNVYKHEENYQITDNFLDNYLKSNGVKSVVELIGKK
jgi:hypothetical protein